MDFARTAAQVYADGPIGSPSQPDKAEIRPLLKQYEDAIAAFSISVNAAVVKGTFVELNAVVSSFADGDIGLVIADPNEALRGVYKRVLGAAWVKQSDLPSDVAQIAADQAIASADAAETARDQAVPAAATATTKADEAAASASIAAGYAAAAGISKVFATKAEADAGLSGVAANAFVKVLVDETQGNVATVYQKVSGAYVLKTKEGRKLVWPEDFGAIGDGVTNDRAALLAAKSWVQTYGGILRLTGGKTYNVGTTATSLGGIAIEPEPNATITGLILPYDDVKVEREARVTVAAGGSVDPWTMVLTREHRKPLLEKSLWISPAALPRSTLAPIVANADLQHVQFTYPGTGNTQADTITTNATGIVVDAYGVAVPTQGAGGFRVSLADIAPKSEVCAYFAADASAGNYGRSGMFRCSNGYIVAWLDANGPLSIGYKLKDAAPVTVTVDWVGRTQVPVYTGRACYMTLRLIDYQTVAILISGKVVWRARIGTDLPADLGFVYKAGFGVTGSAGYATIGNWSRRYGMNAAYGLSPINLLIMGDSLSEDWHGAYPQQLREALYGTSGARCDILANYALGGQTSAQQLTKLTSMGIPVGTTHIVLTLSGNDQQTGVPVATMWSTWSSIKSLADASGVKMHFILSHLPYTRTEAPAHGGDFGAYLSSHLYRTATMRWCADNGVGLTEANQVIPHQIPSYLGTDDEVLRDNVHWTPMAMRLIAKAAAEEIVGRLMPEFSFRMASTAIAADMFRNSWTNGATPLRISVSADGEAALSGILTKFTPASEQVLLLPSIIASERDFTKVVTSTSSNAIRVSGNSAGSIALSGVGGSDGTVYVDGVTWRVKGS